MKFSFGILPDLLSGKKPEDALTDNAKQAAIAAGLYLGGSALAGSGGAGVMGPSMPTAGAPLMDAAGMAIAPASSGGGLLSTLGSAGQAAGAASQIQGLLGSGSSAPMQAPQVPQGNAQGAQTLAQLYQQGMQLSPEDQARMQRKTNWG